MHRLTRLLLPFAWRLALAGGIALAAGCKTNPLEALYGEGFRTSDPTLSSNLRSDPPSEKGTGVSTKAREIERRLGYE